MLSLAAPERATAAPLHTNEVNIDLNNSRAYLTVYDALTGQDLFPTSLIVERRSGSDYTFSVNGAAGQDDIILPERLLVFAFSPASCAGVITFPPCLPLTGGATFAVSMGADGLQSRSFYLPVPRIGIIDMGFKFLPLGSTQSVVEVASSQYSGMNLNTQLGPKWVLPYDLTTLCARGSCNESSPWQFIASGVSTEAVTGHPTWRKLVPEFSFAGSVEVPAAWGAQTWSVSNLRLGFPAGASLTVSGGLTATGTALSDDLKQGGWHGVSVTGGATIFDGVQLTGVSYNDGTEYKRANSAVRVSGGATLTLQGGSEVSGSRLAQGIEATGGATRVIIEDGGTAVRFNDYIGVVAMAGATVTIRNGAQVIGNVGGGVAANGTNAVVELDQAIVDDNNGVGATASGGGLVQTTSSGATGRRSSVSRNHGGLDAADTGSIQMGAFSAKTGACTNCDHLIAGNTVNPNGAPFFDARSFGASTVRAQGNAWGVSCVSQLLLAKDAPSMLIVCPLKDQTTACESIASPSARGAAGSDGWSAGRSGTSEAAGRGAGTAALDMVLEAEDELAGGDADEAAALLVAALDEAATDDERAGVYGGIVRVLAQVQPAVLVASVAARVNDADRPWGLRALIVASASAGDAESATGYAAALASEYAGTDDAVPGLGWLAQLAAVSGDETAAMAHLVALWDAAPTSLVFAASAAVVAAAFPDADLDWIPAARGGDTAAGKTDGVASAMHLGVWPNPTSGSAHLSVPVETGETLDVDVYDGLGRRVAIVAENAASAGSAFDASLPVSNLTPGIYLVRVVRHSADGQVSVSVARLTVAR